MRLLMTTDTVGGVWTYTRELVTGLVEQGVDITLVSFGGAPRDGQRAWAEELARRAPQRFRFLPTEWKLEWMPDGHDSFRDSCEWLLKVIDRERPDVLHLNQIGYGALPVSAPKLVVAHSDVVSWWCARYGETPPANAWMERYQAILASGLAGADAIVTPTAWLSGQIAEHYRIARDAIRVIPNGRSGPLFTRRKRLQAATAGRIWDEGKNIAILAKVTSSMPVYVAGETRAPGESRASRQKVQGNVTFLGPLDEIAMQQLLAESAIYIVTSLYEPFGLAPLEAAFAGCALVVNNIPSLREVWGEAALYYRRNDPAHLSELLDMLAQDPTAVQRAAMRAQERAWRLYTAEAMVRRYSDLYAELLRRGKAAHVA